MRTWKGVLRYSSCYFWFLFVSDALQQSITDVVACRPVPRAYLGMWGFFLFSLLLGGFHFFFL
jgi:hypothetical protein